MRSYDKKKNIEKVNLLAEHRFFESKGIMDYNSLIQQSNDYEVIKFDSKAGRLSSRYGRKEVFDYDVTLKTDNGIIIHFQTTVEEDPDGATESMDYDVLYNGVSIKHELNQDSITTIKEWFQNETNDSDEEVELKRQSYRY